MRSFFKLFAVTAILSAATVAHAAPVTAKSPTVVANAPATAAPKEAEKPTGPQPGKPLQFVGPSFLMFGEKTLQIGTVDMAAKKMLSSIIISPPWNVDGVDVCGTDSLNKTGNTCVQFGKTGSVAAPGGVVLPTVHKADLPKNAVDNTTVYCDDCTVVRSAGLWKTNTVTGVPVIVKKGVWSSFTGESVEK